ncbi:MAG TPA: acyl-CoA dehydrogenase family protein [Actinomycetes bacterium]|nr:acyl-CoA dehydrogenase family protein [Actinomycetes bacterium]
MSGHTASDDRETFRGVVADFARSVVAPVIGEKYEKGEFPVDLVEQMAHLGLFGLPFPESIGGGGGDLLDFGIALEEIGRVDSSLAITLEAAVSLGATPIHRFGSASQQDRWLPDLISGRALGAFGLTEPSGGSDAGNTQTTAAVIGDSWQLNGEKCFITNAGTSLTVFVTATAATGVREDGRQEISTILVPTGTAGLDIGPAYSKVGWRCSDTRPVAFVDCQVPLDNVVGERGRGYAQFLSILDEGRIAIAALSTGLAQGCLDEAVRYSKQREAFGRPIGAHQGLAFQIADMAARVHTSRLAWEDAAWRCVNRRPFKQQAAIAKLVSSEAAMDNARTATQVFGGSGFMNDAPVGRFYRDAKVLEIGEGTSEIQRLLIARELGLPL